MRYVVLLLILALASPLVPASAQQPDAFRLNERGYFERGGVDVMSFQDFYPEGHQGGVTIIMRGHRLAANGDLRLEPTPGQWSPVPKQDDRTVDQENEGIITRLSYPDPEKNRQGFNPIIYPDLDLAYQVRVRPEGEAVRIIVDLDEPLPEAWVGKVGFNLELFPTLLFGKSWYLGGASGIFPRQPNGPVQRDEAGEIQAVPFATGERLTIAPETEQLQLVIEDQKGALQLLDGRNKHNNGWFIVRSLVPGETTEGAIEWLVHPHAIPGWQYDPWCRCRRWVIIPIRRK